MIKLAARFLLLLVWLPQMVLAAGIDGKPGSLRASEESFAAERPGIKRGKLTTAQLASETLGNSRSIVVYTPPGLSRGSPTSDFLLVFDGAEYVTALSLPTILDNMQVDGVIGPIVAVFVDNAPGIARNAELPASPQFQSFLRYELLPWLRERYRFTTDPRRTVVAGSGFGGHAASFTALTHPDLFANVLSQSGSYWWWPGFRGGERDAGALGSDAGWLSHQYANVDRLPLRFYLSAGQLEGPLVLLPSRMFRDALQAKAYDVTYRELEGAQNDLVRRSTLSDGLRALIGAVAPSGASRSTGARAAGEVFKECSDCPEMVVVPAGQLDMGDRRSIGAPDERPAHAVALKSFAMGRYEVTRAQFAAFVRDTGAAVEGNCRTLRPGEKEWDFVAEGTWRTAGFPQTEHDPVVCISWYEASAYVRWLSRRTGHPYRLLTEAEWEFAARAGSDTPYFWGEDFASGCAFANLPDRTLGLEFPELKEKADCDDGFAYSAPVGSFRPNALGLFDMTGNVWEWVQDCYADDYGQAAADGRPHEAPDCARRANRGGSFGTPPFKSRSTTRTWDIAIERAAFLGLRVARTLSSADR